LSWLQLNSQQAWRWSRRGLDSFLTLILTRCESHLLSKSNIHEHKMGEGLKDECHWIAEKNTWNTRLQ
jgi:hypothetical protein